MNDFIKEYQENMKKKAIEELNLKNVYEYDITLVYNANKITIDGINYFNDIDGISIKFHNIEIANYNLKTKKLSTINRHRNIIILQKVVEIRNNFLKCERYKVNDKKLKEFYNFLEDYNDNLSDFEVAELYTTQF